LSVDGGVRWRKFPVFTLNAQRRTLNLFFTLNAQRRTLNLFFTLNAQRRSSQLMAA